MRLDLDDGGDIGLDMGPMIDCVFLLLIFFLVSTTMKKPEMEIAVELPEPAISAQPNAERESTVIAIDQDGVFYVSGVPVGQSELHRRLRDIGQADPLAHVRIDVDRRAPSRFLVQVMDLCAFEGLKNYALHTQSSEIERLGRR